MRKPAKDLKTETLDSIGVLIRDDLWLGVRKSRQLAGFIFKYYKNQILNKKRIIFGEAGTIEVSKKNERMACEPLTGKPHLIPKRLAITLKKSSARNRFPDVKLSCKEDFRNAIIKEFNLSAFQATRANKLIVNLIENVTCNEYRIEIREFGCFYPAIRKACTVRNPSTGENLEKPETVFTRFKVSPNFRLQLENSGNYNF